MRRRGALAILLLAFVTGVLAGRAYGTRTPNLARYDEDIELAAAEAGIDADLLRAVVASESGGDPQARSRAGAVGLCQLMPATAEALAADVGIESYAPKRLYEPRVNLRLGAAYLRRMLARYEGRAPLALAAYNAGGRHVNRWRRRAPDASPREVIEREGYRETRGFVNRVLRLRKRYADE